MKIQSLLKILDIDWPLLSGGNTLIIDGESGDELKDVGERDQEHKMMKKGQEKEEKEEHHECRARSRSRKRRWSC